MLQVLHFPPPTPTTLQGLTIVHGHWMDGGHRLWVASRVTIARLRIGRVGRVPAGQDRWLPIAPLGRRARVQWVAVLIRRWGAGVGHGRSRAEGRPQLLGPEMGDKKRHHECPDQLTQPQSRVPPWKVTLIFSQSWCVILCPQTILPNPTMPPAPPTQPLPSRHASLPSTTLLIDSVLEPRGVTGHQWGEKQEQRGLGTTRSSFKKA